MYWRAKTERYHKLLLAAETITIGQLVYITTSETVALAKADSATTMPAVGFAGFGAAAGAAVEIVTRGRLAGSAVDMGSYIGDAVYVSDNTAGTYERVAPTIAQLVGYAIGQYEIEVAISQVTGTVGAGTVVAAHLGAKAVETAKIDDLAVTEAQISANAKVQRMKSPIINIDAGAGTHVVYVIGKPSVPIEITKAQIIYTEATAAAGATAATIKVGTTSTGEQIVAATSIEQPKAIGSATAMVIAEGTVAADATIFCELVGVVATPIVGEVIVELEYNTLEA